MAQKVVSIIGGTGNTGKWALKGALVRDYKVKLLARNPDKVKKILTELFGEKEGEAMLGKVEIVKGSVMDEAAMDELLEGADAVLSFLGILGSAPKTWVVAPGVEAILKAMKNIAATGNSPPKFVSMSAMGLGDSWEQGRCSHWVVGRMLVYFFIPYFLYDCFADMAAAEEHIMAEKDLVTTIVRAPILDDGKDYLRDFTEKETGNFSFADASVTSGIQSAFLDRQDVAAGILNCVESQEFDNKAVTVLKMA
jgi:uncharacterized protein YbjT (DUF2867 family)